MKLVRWGRHKGGAEVSQLGRRELPREKVIWRPRGMNGGGRGKLGGEWNHVLCMHLSEMWGGVTVLPLPLGFSAWVCLLRVGDSRVTLLLPNVGMSDFGRGGRVLKYSGRERFRARRACFEI